MARVQHSIYRTLYTPPEGVEITVPYSFLGAPYGEEELDAAAMFVFIGADPYTAWLDGAIQLDDLGFVPTGPAALYTGADGKIASRFTIDSASLGTLRRLAEKRATDREMIETGLRDFFQQAGFDNQGELVLLTPKHDTNYNEEEL